MRGHEPGKEVGPLFPPQGRGGRCSEAACSCGMSTHVPPPQTGESDPGHDHVFPAHKAGLHLIHNEHRDYYQTAKEWIEEQADDYLSWPAGEKEKAIAEDSIWVLHWYPDTPIGFYCLAASTLEACLAASWRVEAGGDV